MPIHLFHFVSTGYIIIQNGKLSNILTGMYNYWTFRWPDTTTLLPRKEKTGCRKSRKGAARKVGKRKRGELARRHNLSCGMGKK